MVALENEKKGLLESQQKFLVCPFYLISNKKHTTELELKLKSRECESSIQISQTELALSRLTALRSQLAQLQNCNEKMEEFLARFKSSGTRIFTLKNLVSEARSKNQRLECEKDILTKKLVEANCKIISLQESILQLTVEKETWKSQVNIEDKISHYAVC